MNISEMEDHFYEKSNQLKALSNLLSSVNEDALYRDTLGFIGHLLTDISEELDKDFTRVYEHCKQGKKEAV